VKNPRKESLPYPDLVTPDRTSLDLLPLLTNDEAAIVRAEHHAFLFAMGELIDSYQRAAQEMQRVETLQEAGSILDISTAPAQFALDQACTDLQELADNQGTDTDLHCLTVPILSSITARRSTPRRQPSKADVRDDQVGRPRPCTLGPRYAALRSSAATMRRTSFSNVSTTTGSNCVPECRRISASASSTGIALR